MIELAVVGDDGDGDDLDLGRVAARLFESRP